MLRASLSKISKEYALARSENFSGHALAEYIRKDLPDIISSLLGKNSGLIIKSSPGKGVWAHTPWLALLNPIITTTPQTGYYPAYLFSEDLKKIYLSLNQGVTSVRNKYRSSAHVALKAKAAHFRAILGKAADHFPEHSIALNHSGKSHDLPLYESANICSIKYDAANLPSDSILAKDLHEMLNLYNILFSLESNLYSEDEPATPSIQKNSTKYTENANLKIHERIERNHNIAKKAKKIHGHICMACGFNFREMYGAIGEGYIEAHHLQPISEYKGQHRDLDPAKDFAVLCANCHRMIHKTDFTSSIDDFKKFLLFNFNQGGGSC